MYMMYGFKLLSLAVIVVIVNEALSLSCYECIGPPNGGCSNGNLADLVKIPCSQNKFMKKPVAVHMELENAVEASGLCVQAVIIANNATLAERACAFAPPGVDFCEVLKQLFSVVSCSTCTYDYCNSKPFRHETNTLYKNVN